MRKAVQKLKSRRGSSLPEAMIGFLIVCMTSLILVGVISVSGDIMGNGDEMLKQVYKEKEAFDVFTYHKYDCWEMLGKDKTSFQYYAGSDAFTAVKPFQEDSSGKKASFTFTDQGDAGTGVAADNTYNGTAEIAYCRAVKHNVFCFSTPPEEVVH